MNVPKAWLQVFCLVSVFGQICGNVDTKEYFCGKKLVRTLTELCSIYNNPTTARQRSRFPRQIVEECCRSQCSRRYLVQYYCQEARSPIVKLLKADPQNSSKTAHEKDAKIQSDHFQTSEERNSLIVGSTEETTNPNAFPSKSESLAITHKKRPCKCRKRRAKRKKKQMKFHSLRNVINNRHPVPPANIGHVEHSQTPFYVWRFSRMY